MVGTLDGMSDGDFVGYTVVVSVGGCVAAMHSFKNGTQREWRLDIQTKTPSHCTLLDSTVLPHAVLLLFCILILYRLLIYLTASELLPELSHRQSTVT